MARIILNGKSHHGAGSVKELANPTAENVKEEGIPFLAENARAQRLPSRKFRGTPRNPLMGTSSLFTVLFCKA